MAQQKILVVDDDPDLSKAVQAMLENAGYQVELADDKNEGMKKVKSEKPDLLILDVMMATWQDGFEMARELKQNSESKSMPILMVTGVKDKSGIDFKSTAGDPVWLPVDGFLDKPVEVEELLAEVRKLLADKK